MWHTIQIRKPYHREYTEALHYRCTRIPAPPGEEAAIMQILLKATGFAPIPLAIPMGISLDHIREYLELTFAEQSIHVNENWSVMQLMPPTFSQLLDELSQQYASRQMLNDIPEVMPCPAQA